MKEYIGPKEAKDWFKETFSESFKKFEKTLFKGGSYFITPKVFEPVNQAWQLKLFL